MSNQKDSRSEAYIIKEFLLEALSYKYFYIVSLAVCLITALIINKFSPNVYGVNSIIGPVEDKRTTLLGSNSLFSGMPDITQTRNLENDINSLNSFNLVSETIKSLNLEVGYFTEKKNLFKQIHQVYLGSPYSVNIDKSHIQPIDTRINIKILDDKSFRLSDESTLKFKDKFQHISFCFDNGCHFIHIMEGIPAVPLLKEDKGVKTSKSDISPPSKTV